MLPRFLDCAICVHSDLREEDFSESASGIVQASKTFFLPLALFGSGRYAPSRRYSGRRPYLSPRGGLRGSAGGPMRDPRDLAYATAFIVAPGKQR